MMCDIVKRDHIEALVGERQGFCPTRASVQTSAAARSDGIVVKHQAGALPRPSRQPVPQPTSSSLPGELARTCSSNSRL